MYCTNDTPLIWKLSPVGRVEIEEHFNNEDDSYGKRWC